jgi:hypothetical protein
VGVNEDDKVVKACELVVLTDPDVSRRSCDLVSIEYEAFCSVRIEVTLLIGC